MKIITNLAGETSEAQWNEPRGILQSIHDEPQPGLLRRMTLGAGGLMFQRANIKVAIPFAELIKLFEQHEPGLTEPKAPATVEAAPDPSGLRDQSPADEALRTEATPLTPDTSHLTPIA